MERKVVENIGVVFECGAIKGMVAYPWIQFSFTFDKNLFYLSKYNQKMLNIYFIL